MVSWSGLKFTYATTAKTSKQIRLTTCVLSGNNYMPFSAGAPPRFLPGFGPGLRPLRAPVPSPRPFLRPGGAGVLSSSSSCMLAPPPPAPECPKNSSPSSAHKSRTTWFVESEFVGLVSSAAFPLASCFSRFASSSSLSSRDTISLGFVTSVSDLLPTTISWTYSTH